MRGPSPFRLLWLAGGIVSLACGVAGTVLPLVPTTPFVLLSAYAFARSSPRLHQWLVTHAHFGPLITNWNRYGAIDRRTKAIALSVMVLTPPLTWAIGAPGWALLAQIFVLSGAALFVATRPAGPPDEDAET